MRLQKQLSKKVSGVNYYKWVLVFSPKIIKQVGWKEGQKFKIIIKSNKITLEPLKEDWR